MTMGMAKNPPDPMKKRAMRPVLLLIKELFAQAG